MNHDQSLPVMKKFKSQQEEQKSKYNHDSHNNHKKQYLQQDINQINEVGYNSSEDENEWKIPSLSEIKLNKNYSQQKQNQVYSNTKGNNQNFDQKNNFQSTNQQNNDSFGGMQYGTSPEMKASGKIQDDSSYFKYLQNPNHAQNASDSRSAEKNQFFTKSKVIDDDQQSFLQLFSANSPNVNAKLNNDLNISAPNLIFKKDFDNSPDYLQKNKVLNKFSNHTQNKDQQGVNPQKREKKILNISTNLKQQESLDQSMDKSRELRSDQKLFQFDNSIITGSKDISAGGTPNKKPSRSTTMHQKNMFFGLSGNKAKQALEKKKTLYKSTKQIFNINRKESTDKSFISNIGTNNVSPDRKSQLEDFIKVVNEKREILNKRKEKRSKNSLEVQTSQKSEFLRKVQGGKDRKSYNMLGPGGFNFNQHNTQQQNKELSSSSDDENKNNPKFSRRKAVKFNSQEKEFMKGFKLMDKHRKISEDQVELSNGLTTNSGVKRIVNVRNFFQEVVQKDDEEQLSQLQAQINNQSANQSIQNTQINNNLPVGPGYKSSSYPFISTPVSETQINNLFQSQGYGQELRLGLSKLNDENLQQSDQFTNSQASGLAVPKRKQFQRRRSFVGSSGLIEEMIDRATTPRKKMTLITPKFQVDSGTLTFKNQNGMKEVNVFPFGHKDRQISSDDNTLFGGAQTNAQTMNHNNNRSSFLTVLKDDFTSHNITVDQLKIPGDVSSKPLTVDLGADSSQQDRTGYDNRLKNELSFSMIDDQIIRQKLPSFLINPTAIWKTLWNAIILMLILFLAVTVPYRISFEDTPTTEWIYLDIIIDGLFCLDLIFNFCTAFEDENGVLVISRKRIALVYIKSWFFVDLMSSIPITAIQQYGGLGQSVINVKFIKLSRLPRLYRLLRLMKLIRLYKSNKIVQKMLSATSINIGFTQMINSLVIMIFLLHLIGCLWATVSSLSAGDYPRNWQTTGNLVNAETIDLYISSVFWAAVTILTVGYGDIVPQNDFEVAVNIVILFVGVSLYAYTFSKLSTLFSSVNSKDVNAKTRDAIISELAQTHNFTKDITNKIQYFFSQNSNLISLSKEYAVDELLRILPAHLKAEISFFLYKDAIEKLKILQGLDQRFYAEFISKFEPMRIKNGTIFAKEGQCPQEVFFLLKGCILCQKQNKYYLEGAIFGEVEILLKKNRIESYVAKSDCYLLKLDRSIFEQILEEFPKIREEIQIMVVQREKNRIENLQQAKINQDIEQDKRDLQNLMSKIDFHKIEQKKQGLKRQSTISAAEFHHTFGEQLKKENPKEILNSQQTHKQFNNINRLQSQTSKTSNKFDIMSFGPQSPNKKDKDLFEEQKRNNPPLLNEFSNIQENQNLNSNNNNQSSNLLMNDSLQTSTYREKDSLETIQDRSSEEDDDDEDDHLYEEMKIEQKKRKNTQQTPSQLQKGSHQNNQYIDTLGNQIQYQPNSGKNSQLAPSVNDYQDQNYFASAQSRGESKRISVQNVDTIESLKSQRLQRKITNHMHNIQHLRNSQLKVISEQSKIDSKSVMDTLINTKNKIKHEQQTDNQEYLEKVQMQFYQEDEINFGSEAQHQTGFKEFSVQLRQSLQRLQESIQQEETVVRPTTHRDLPVSMPNKRNITSQIPILEIQQVQPNNQLDQNNQESSHQNQSDSIMTETTIPQNPSIGQSNAPTPPLYMQFNQQLNLHFQSNFNNENQNSSRQLDFQTSNVAPTPEQEGIAQLMPILDEDLMRLNQHINSCKYSIQITRNLILEYCNVFESTVEQQGEDANEIIRRQYLQGMKCLESYINIMNMIEKLISQLNIDQLSQKVTSTISRTNESEKRFYFLENKMKVMNTILDQRIAQLQKDKERILQERPLIIVRRNPLLDDRDSRHCKWNENLLFSSNKEMNL
eukprot:403367218